MKKTMRQMLCLVTALCLALSFAPAAFADGETTVTTAEALKAALADGGNIALGADITVSEALTVSGDTVLDLNGHTLAVDHNGQENYAVLVSAALTVRDSGTGGKLTSGETSTMYLDYGEGVSGNALTLESGTLENTADYGFVIVALGWTVSTVTVTGGTVSSAPVGGGQKGDSIFAQAEVHISGGSFNGPLDLSDEGRTARQTVTGGSFDMPLNMDSSFDSASRIDFYGTQYEAVQAGDRYAVQKAFEDAEKVTIRYAFPDVAEASKRDDVFRSGAEIDAAPEAPYPENYEFVGWYTDAALTAEAAFPMAAADMTLYGKFVEASEPEPGDGVFSGNMLKNLVVGGTPMVEDGVVVSAALQSGGGTAALDYVDDVYTLTLDTYVYSGEGFCWESAQGNVGLRCGVYADGDLAVVLKGKSAITVDNGTDSGALGVAVRDGCLAILSDGDGSLSLTVNTSKREDERNYAVSIGIYVDGGETAERLGLLVRDCEVEVATTLEGNDSVLSAGVAVGTDSMSVPGSVAFDGAAVRLASKAGRFGAVGGMAVFGDIALENGSEVTITASCTDDAGEGSFAGIAVTGVECEGGALAVRGGSRLSVSSETEKTFLAVGVSADDIYISDAEAEIETPDAFWKNTGVRATDSVIVVDGRLSAVSGNADNSDSIGLQAGCLYIFGSDSEVSATGGGALSGNSVGIETGGEFGVEDGMVNADGGEAGLSSAGVSAEGPLWLTENAYMHAFGGNAGNASFGIRLSSGRLVMSATGETEEGAYPILFAMGREAVESYGVYVSAPEEDEPAISLSSGAIAYAVGSVAGDDDGNGQSYGVWTDGSVEIDGADLTAAGREGSDNTIGLCLYGDDLQLVMTGKAELYAGAGSADEGSAGVLFRGENGTLSLGRDGYLRGYAGEAEYSIGIGNVAVLSLEGRLLATANAAEESYGLLMASDAPLSITEGVLAAAGSTAALCARSEAGAILSVTITAPAIDYSADRDSDQVTSVEAEGGVATLVSDGTQKQLVVTAGGTIYSLRVSGVNTNLVSGVPVRFTADVTPASMVKIVEERWTRSDGAVVISSLDASPTLPEPGTYRYTIVLAPISEKFAFNTEYEVTVLLAEDPELGLDAEAEDGLLVVSDPEYFIGDVTVAARDYPHGGDAPADSPDASDGDSVTAAGRSGSASLDAAFEGDTATLLSGDVSALLGGDVGFVSIDLTGREEEINEAVLPAELLSQLADSDAEGMEIRLSGGAVTLGAAALDALAERGEPVAISLRADADGSAVVDVSTDGEPYAATVRVVLPATDGQVLTLVGPDGTAEPVKLSYTENGAACALVPAGAALRAADAEPMRFDDVKDGAWFAGAVDYVTSRGVFRGTTHGFEPERPMSRAMLATVLFRIAGETAPAGGTAFGDVPAEAWYAEAVAWAYDAGIVNGRGSGFAPGAPVTREEIAAMLYRFAAHLGLDVSGSASLAEFTDGEATSAWAREAMQWAVGAGLFQGDGNGTLNPGGESSRAEVAALSERLVKLIVG